MLLWLYQFFKQSGRRYLCGVELKKLSGYSFLFFVFFPINPACLVNGIQLVPTDLVHSSNIWSIILLVYQGAALKMYSEHYECMLLRF